MHEATPDLLKVVSIWVPKVIHTSSGSAQRGRLLHMEAAEI
jgi:hypothetical protein